MKIKAMLFISLIALAGACKKGTGSGAESGDGCAGIDRNDARMRCNNNNVEFCSSYSQYRWQETNKCGANQKCFISPDGKSGGCK